MDLEKFVEIELLFSLYQQLLTEKQRQVMEYYYQEDYSLSEISDLLGISRQAVHDNIKRTEIQLFEYESKLRLSDKLSKTEELERNINQLEEFLKHNTVSLRTKKLVATIKSQCKELLE
ncbi:YlxM family DNA-binding protein [Filifactor alocis]